jgi:hypothetical protein
MHGCFATNNPNPAKSPEKSSRDSAAAGLVVAEDSKPMKSIVSSFLLSTAILVAAAPAFAQSPSDKKAAPPTESEVVAKARAEYPLKTCLVSDEGLGSMGDAIPYVHRVAGKPDRVVFFCCEGCTDDFKADPAKYLKKLDDAAKGKGPAGKKSATSEHKGKH